VVHQPINAMIFLIIKDKAFFFTYRRYLRLLVFVTVGIAVWPSSPPLPAFNKGF
jgi:hypothetical protein